MVKKKLENFKIINLLDKRKNKNNYCGGKGYNPYGRIFPGGDYKKIRAADDQEKDCCGWCHWNVVTTQACKKSICGGPANECDDA